MHNWSWTPTTVTLPAPMTDLLAEGSDRLEDIDLGPWDVRVLIA